MKSYAKAGLNQTSKNIIPLQWQAGKPKSNSAFESLKYLNVIIIIAHSNSKIQIFTLDPWNPMHNKGKPHNPVPRNPKCPLFRPKSAVHFSKNLLSSLHQTLIIVWSRGRHHTLSFQPVTAEWLRCLRSSRVVCWHPTTMAPNELASRIAIGADTASAGHVGWRHGARSSDWSRDFLVCFSKWV